MQSPVDVVIVGMGRAGMARMKDLQITDEHIGIQELRLAGYVSRREGDLHAGAGEKLHFDEMLKNSDIKAVMVCTENESHEDMARKALTADKHVSVDYPITVTSEAAIDLFALADKNGLAYHEEKIGLLTESHKYLKDKSTKTPATKANFTFKGGFNGWIEDTANSGSPFISNINLLYALLDICGDLTPVGATIKIHSDSMEAVAQLKTENGNSVSVNISRYMNCTTREKSFHFQFADGSVITNDDIPAPNYTAQSAAGGLFMRDMRIFSQRISEKYAGKSTSVEEIRSRWLTIRGLQLAEQLKDLASA